MLVMGEHHAEEELLLSALHLDGGKVLHLGRIGVLLDIHPAEFRLREALGERQEPGPVGLAGIAPFGAEAGDDGLHA